MKNLIIYLVLALILVGSAMASCDKPAYVAGKIYESDHSTTVSDASVTVNCNGIPKTATSTSVGTYLVKYDNTAACECDVGDTANVDASKGGQSGSSSGTVDAFGTIIDIAVVNVSIPEFGVIAASVAMIGAIAGIVAFRKH